MKFQEESVSSNKRNLIVIGVQHNGPGFGPGDPGSNPGKDQYNNEFKLIIQVMLSKQYKLTIALARVCDSAIGDCLVGGDKQPLQLQN